MKANVFDIQRSSFVDGDGARTVIFFKGCNLRCKWCHNPEGLKNESQLLYYKDKCIDCKKCVSACPNNQKSCTLCGKCTVLCPADAREICGRGYTVGELLEIIEKDKDYYLASGGGVTFSGGECMLQVDFLSKLLEKCKERGINTAIDTAGNVPWKSFEAVIDTTDIFLYDIKCISPDLHKKGTGVENRLILENLHKLNEMGKSIIVRVPVIGGFNDTAEEITKIAELLRKEGLKRVELLPYHQMGKHKYEALCLETGEFYTPSKEKIKEFNEIIKGDLK